MDLGTILSVAQCLYSALNSRELNEVLSIFGYKSQLDELQQTVKTINAVLRDAENKQEHSHEAQNWIEELKAAVFEADDLFDEFVTLAELKQLRKGDGSLSKKVSNFFSRSQNPIHIAFRMSRGIKDIKKKLDGIASNSKFSFKLNLEPTRRRRPETCSYVDEVDIIGRKDDLESIVGMLLDSNVHRDVSFLSIVGIGGLGKTALSQLLYNDPRVTDAFSLKLWTCVSDQDQHQLDVKDIICKILGTNNEISTMNQLQRELREKLASNRYLLVLDDVWTEKREQWHALASLLMGGQRGSWIVVTTRSQETSRIIGDGMMYKLQGLSDENSWLLFERIAFGSEQSNSLDDLVSIGRDIIGRCGRVPLAIRVVGSLLYGQDKSRWISVRDSGLANFRENKDDIMPALMLSYRHLESPLKSCFSFCAVFPKDFVIEKSTLISVWMAQGYIVPFDEGQSIEDAGEEYFLILARRCFFQDFKTDNVGEISCKIHDLMHDVALKVSGKEISSTNTLSNNLDKKVQHLSLAKSGVERYSFRKTHIRSIFFLNKTILEENMVKSLVANCKWLRVLHLNNSTRTTLPDSIGQLLHLRYLNLSGYSDLEALPKSITKLYNLQTLGLIECFSLEELPKDFSKLVKLRALDLGGCISLQCMPGGMNKLTCLHRLSKFIVGNDNESCLSSKEWFDGLDDLKALNKLRGYLTVEIVDLQDVEDFDKEYGKREGLYLRDKEHLDFLFIYFRCKRVIQLNVMHKLMKDLEPHSNLKSLMVQGYLCANMPNWFNILPNLVHLHLEDCLRLEHLSGLVNLRHLKSLKLLKLRKLEYIGGVFPDLESLVLLDLPMLKTGLAEDSSSNAAQVLLEGPKLKKATVSSVAWLKLLPVQSFYCLESLEIIDDQEVENLREIEEVFLKCSSSLRFLKLRCCPNLSRIVYGGLEHVIALEELHIFGCDNLKLLKEEEDEEKEKIGDGIGISIMSRGFCCDSLRSLTLKKLYKLESLPDWIQYFTRLQFLEVSYCNRLESVPKWMRKLTSLRKLELVSCSKTLQKRCQKDPPGEDWPYVQHIPLVKC